MNRETLLELEAFLKKVDPAFEVRWKSESLSMRVVGFGVRPFNAKFMSEYATALGSKVYFPSREAYLASPDLSLRTLAHGFVHAWDYRQNRLSFCLTYGSPQVWSLPFFGLALLLCLRGLFEGSLLAALSGLVALAPWPSRGRSRWELRGFSMSLAVYVWTRGRLPSQEMIASVASNFTGLSYWKMCWDRQSIESELRQASTNALRGSLQETEPYKTVYDFLKSHGRIRV